MGIKTLEIYPSGYASDDYAYQSIANVENGYTPAASNTCATINLVTGSNAETYVYYKFDLSEIPSNAVVIAVTCKVKANIRSSKNWNVENSSVISVRTMQLYSQTVAKGSEVLIYEDAIEQAITVGDWTRAELTDCRLKLYGKRGSFLGTTADIYINFYGATLVVEYEEAKTLGGYVEVAGTLEELSKAYANIDGIWKELLIGYTNINSVWKTMFDNAVYTYSLSEFVENDTQYEYPSTIGSNYSINSNTGEITLENSEIVSTYDEFANYVGTYGAAYTLVDETTLLRINATYGNYAFGGDVATVIRTRA